MLKYSIELNKEINLEKRGECKNVSCDFVCHFFCQNCQKRFQIKNASIETEERQ